MKKTILVTILLSVVLVGCSLFTGSQSEKPLTDAEMATRVAELLTTMTSPTAEIVFPPTPTVGLPTIAPTEQATTAVETPVVVTTEPPSVPATPTATPQVTESTPLPPEPTATLAPSATATVPATDPALKLGNPTGSDPLDSYAKWAWPTGSDAFLNVEFKDGFMKMTNLSKDAAGWRLPLISQQTNTYIELTANSGTCTGKDSYGIIFRIPVFKEPDQGYLFQVTCDGYYRLWKWDGKVLPNGAALSLLNWKQSSAIISGANQTNRLGVMIVDKKFKLYMNGVLLGEASDSSYAAGFFGVFVRSGSSTNYTVNFDAMKYWENPAQ